MIENNSGQAEVESQNEDALVDFLAKNSDLNGKFIHVKVGDASWSEESLTAEISRVHNQLNSLLTENGIDCFLYVTHSQVEISVIESSNPKGGVGN